ncbi:MAG: hypothetical protein M1819_003152 [Sarea resinae]|nr:MAG: hypothetical protein M1819_003152 [Sarea resinae]
MAREQMSPPPPPPRWVLDLNSKTPAKPKCTSIPDPPGYSAALSSGSSNKRQQSKTQPAPPKGPTPEEMDTLKLKKSWELALGPAKQIPMNAIMMYMSGNSLQIFSIMMVYMLFKTPIQGLLNTNQAFARFESDRLKSQLLGVKAVYVLMQCLGLALAIWKVNGMGLLPTTTSDWLAWEVAREPLERAIPAFR